MSSAASERAAVPREAPALAAARHPFAHLQRGENMIEFISDPSGESSSEYCNEKLAACFASVHFNRL